MAAMVAAHRLTALTAAAMTAAMTAALEPAAVMEEEEKIFSY